MRRFRNHIIGVEQGSVMLFSDFEDGGQMWTGSGQRELRKKVTFSESFAGPPAVQVALSLWDMDQKTNQRGDIAAADVTKDGFTIVFKTWGDTRVARVRASWMAFGELAHKDDWDVE